jgi:uncharacterized protein
MQDQITATEQESLRAVDKPVIDDALIEEITRRIVEGVHPERVILFGSRSRGDNHSDSDLDVFVEWETPESRLDRYMKVLSLFHGRRWSMDLIVMTPKEVRERRNSRHSIVPIIEREGKVLFDRSLVISNA